MKHTIHLWSLLGRLEKTANKRMQPDQMPATRAFGR